MSAEPDISPRVRWSDAITSRLIRDQLIAAALLAATFFLSFVAVDRFVEWIPTPAGFESYVAHPTLRERSAFVHSLLTLFGLPTTVLVALASFAVPVLRPTATAGALLLHRPYRLGWAERRWLSFWRRNPFSSAFVLAVGLSGALLLMTAGLAAGQLRAQLPTLAVASSLALAAGILFIKAIVWTLRMRDGMALVTHVTQLGLNVIAHVRAGVRSTPIHDISPGERFAYVEQVELNQCLDTLVQQALHVGDEPAASAAALRGLRVLQRAAVRSGASSLWRERPDAAGLPSNSPWVEEAVIGALGKTITGSIRRRDTEVGRAAGSILLAIGTDLTELASPTSADFAVMDLVFRSFRESFQASVEEGEFLLRQTLLVDLATLLMQVANPASSATVWRGSGGTP